VTTVSADFQGHLERVIEDPPFKFAMPAYVPEGYIPTDKVEVYKEDKAILTRWVNKDEDEIIMLIEVNQGQGYLIGVGAAQEIQIDGQPAMLVYGGYDQNGTWDSSLKMVNIYLRKDDLIYMFSRITSQTNTTSQYRLTEELIRMAGSID
jgi:transketolase N-terminal domain/subunit